MHIVFGVMAGSFIARGINEENRFKLLIGILMFVVAICIALKGGFYEM